MMDTNTATLSLVPSFHHGGQTLPPGQLIWLQCSPDAFPVVEVGGTRFPAFRSGRNAFVLEASACVENQVYENPVHVDYRLHHRLPGGGSTRRAKPTTGPGRPTPTPPLDPHPHPRSTPLKPARTPPCPWQAQIPLTISTNLMCKVEYTKRKSYFTFFPDSVMEIPSPPPPRALHPVKRGRALPPGHRVRLQRSPPGLACMLDPASARVPAASHVCRRKHTES